MKKLTLLFSVLLLTILLLLVEANAAPTVARAAPSTPAAAAVSQDITFPPLTGSYKVGRTEYEWVDQSRAETYASIPGLKRDLMVYIWFPASPSKRATIAPYMDNSILWDIWAQYPALEFTAVVPSYASQESLVHLHAYTTTTLDTSQPNYPVLIFEHTAFGTPLSYESIIEEVASHGYIVIGVTHPYSTAAISYPDGRLLRAGIASAANTLNTHLLTIWTQDTRFVLDQAETLNSTDPNFKGHLDLTHIGIFGHSFGGEAAINVTATDPRIKAGASLDLDVVGLTGDAAPKVNSQPFFFLGTVPNHMPVTPDKYALYIQGAAHLNYGDFGLLGSLIPDLGPGPLSSLDPVYGLQITNSYLLAFFDHYLKGAPLNWPTNYSVSRLIVLK